MRSPWQNRDFVESRPILGMLTNQSRAIVTCKFSKKVGCAKVFEHDSNLEMPRAKSQQFGHIGTIQLVAQTTIIISCANA